jgi:alpha-D-ribose 1-methylphosphonate 5-triphosphate synthase subunit PhnH
LSSNVVDPVDLQQRAFRVLLSAISRPGTVCRLPVERETSPKEVLKLLLQTLLDHEVGFAMAGCRIAGVDAEQIVRWTHASSVPVSRADFFLVDGPDSGGLVRQAPRGTPEMPDRGATAIYMSDLDDNPSSTRLNLSGPGVPPGKEAVTVCGLNAAELDDLKRANARLPLGVDAFVVQPGPAVIGLPRSTVIRKG